MHLTFLRRIILLGVLRTFLEFFAYLRTVCTVIPPMLMVDYRYTCIFPLFLFFPATFPLSLSQPEFSLQRLGASYNGLCRYSRFGGIAILSLF